LKQELFFCLIYNLIAKLYTGLHGAVYRNYIQMHLRAVIYHKQDKSILALNAILSLRALFRLYQAEINIAAHEVRIIVETYLCILYLINFEFEDVRCIIAVHEYIGAVGTVA
jgi:hypothetical protein